MSSVNNALKASLRYWLVSCVVLTLLAGVVPCNVQAVLGESPAARRSRSYQIANLNSSQRVPALGADLVFMEWPYPLIEAWQDPEKGDELARALDSAGITTVRIAFLGAYSAKGPKDTKRLEGENKVPLDFPWFPFGDFAEFIAVHHFTAVVGINVEEGPEVGEQIVNEFASRGALSKLVAIELSNEPHLSSRPWLPEDYASKAASLINKLTPMGVRFGLPLTVGNESKTPTRLSDNQWCKRMLTALASQIDLKNRRDIYGVIHLYARGVGAGAIDVFNHLVQPFMPDVRYLVTEFNIRSSLEGNPHLTDAYGLEFARKVAGIMSRPEVVGMYSHAVPYHSLLYFVTRKGIPTVVGHKDPKLGPADLAPGWHLTPPGRVYAFFSTIAWRGRLLTFSESQDAEFWAVKYDGSQTVYSLLNSSDSPIRRQLRQFGGEASVTAPAHSIVCVDSSGHEIGRLQLRP